MLAQLSGLAVGTVRNLVSAGEFDAGDLHEVICWVNARRRYRGLPLIGVANHEIELDEPRKLELRVHCGGYNPLTGEYPP
jgi:hypothetical protein